MNCSKCGKQLPAGKKFCTGCGATVVAPAPSPVTTTPKKTAPVQKTNSETVTDSARDASARPFPPTPEYKLAEEKKANKAAAVAGGVLGAIAVVARAIIFPRMGAHRRSHLAIPGIIIVLLLLGIVAIGQRCDRQRASGAQSSEKSSDETYAPKGFRMLDSAMTDSEDESLLEIKIEISSANPDEKTLEAALLDLHGKWLNRLKAYRGFHTKKMTIRAYATESVSRHDPEWWVARLYWAQGDRRPFIEYQMEALLPRHTAMGYSGLPREDYLEQADKAANDMQLVAREIRDLLKQYEEMMIEDAAFKSKALIQAEAFAALTQELPEPPWNDCIRLNEIFVELAESTYYFQDLFGPDSTLFSGRRLNTAEVHEELQYFFDTFKAYRAERGKY